MRRYRGLSRSEIVDRIEHALRKGGAEVLSCADPTTAPFEFTVKTPTGMRSDDRAFWFLGPASYVKHQSELPIGRHLAS